MSSLVAGNQDIFQVCPEKRVILTKKIAEDVEI